MHHRTNCLLVGVVVKLILSVEGWCGEDPKMGGGEKST